MKPKHFLLPLITPAIFFTAIFTFAWLFLPPTDSLQNIENGLAAFFAIISIAVVFFYAVLFMFAIYILAVTPVVCWKYGKMIKRTLDSKKLRVFFVFYNSILLTAFPAIIFQNILVGAASLIWFLIWSLPPALVSSQDEQDVLPEEAPIQTE